MDKQQNTIRTNLKRYRIFLSWGVTNLFKDKKKAAAYQVKLNTWINDTFFELNHVYANLWYQYRKSWTFMDADIDDKMKYNFNNVEITIHRLFRAEYRGVDGTFYALEEIEKLCSELRKCCVDLSEYYKRRNYFEKLKELNINAKELKRILHELQEETEPGDLGKALRRED